MNSGKLEGQLTGNINPEPLPAHFRKTETREWWMWSATMVVTLALTAGLASFLLSTRAHEDNLSAPLGPQAVQGLLGLVLIFDIYTLYQQLQIHRIRRQFVQREELFRLISENAADLIAVVDMDGNRIYNSLSHEKVLGYSADELKAFSSSSKFIRRTKSA